MSFSFKNQGQNVMAGFPHWYRGANRIFSIQGGQPVHLISSLNQLEQPGNNNQS